MVVSTKTVNRKTAFLIAIEPPGSNIGAASGPPCELNPGKMNSTYWPEPAQVRVSSLFDTDYLTYRDESFGLRVRFVEKKGRNCDLQSYD